VLGWVCWRRALASCASMATELCFRLKYSKNVSCVGMVHLSLCNGDVAEKVSEQAIDVDGF